MWLRSPGGEYPEVMQTLAGRVLQEEVEMTVEECDDLARQLLAERGDLDPQGRRYAELTAQLDKVFGERIEAKARELA